VNVSDLRSNIRERVAECRSSGEPFAVIQGGEPVAVLMPRQMYEALATDYAARQAAAEGGFPDCLSAAAALALADEANGIDDGELRGVVERCRLGPVAARAQLTPTAFLRQALWCIGSIQKSYAVRIAYWDDQEALFRGCDPAAVTTDSKQILEEWTAYKRYLNARMVKAIIEIATRIQRLGWDAFCDRYLALPSDPNSRRAADWEPVAWALQDLPMVGHAISWYLLRNLYGAPCFKPDVHILAIAEHFFGSAPDPVSELAGATERCWNACVGRHDPRLVEFHLGIADYLLWWYRRRTGLPGAIGDEDGESAD
jgi:PHD/YefM family antitoxin component YafN of YafNO toxin-antitoxin module